MRDVDWPEAVTYSNVVGAIIITEAAAYHAPNFPSRRDDYGEQVATMLDLGLQVKATSYVQAMRVMQDARRGAADRALEDVDVLMTPMTPQPAPLIKEVLGDENVVRRTAFSSLIDLTGQPAMSIPCGLTSVKLPIALQIIGRRWDETSVLWAGRAYEQVRGPFPVPPLALNT